ncbi:hypothetical protein [Chondromyces crocatus]|uniref:Uncharacterized protein n=1 Tax=Chondromyces crocatus TaxID=52 RepID=A0A0K1E6F0_CHOCO|nr:hypothetical protein [Chondromyces crocatus]AKT36461.1 uncharacterized protein CMC5_005760 [Chondromyces crocatus]
MQYGLDDEYTWYEWAEALPTEETPSPELHAIAAGFAAHARHCLPTWCHAGALSPLAALARAFGPREAGLAQAQGLQVSHLRFLAAPQLTEQLAALPDLTGLEGVEVSGDEGSKLAPKESAALVQLAKLGLRELDLEGVPSSKDIEPLRPTLARLSLLLQDKPRATELFERPWPALRELRLERGNATDMAGLAALLPAMYERLPACEALDLFETSITKKVPLLEAMPSSPWIAQLVALRISDHDVPPDRLMHLAQVPFQRLRHLGLGISQARPQLANALASSPSLSAVETLQIHAKVGKAGLQCLIEAWPHLRRIAVWDPPTESVDEVIETFGLRPFVARGGVVVRRVS